MQRRQARAFGVIVDVCTMCYVAVNGDLAANTYALGKIDFLSFLMDGNVVYTLVSLRLRRYDLSLYMNSSHLTLINPNKVAYLEGLVIS